METISIVNQNVVEKLEICQRGKSVCTDINIVITNVSPVSLNGGKLQERKYKDADGNHFVGVMTNEAPIKSIAHRLGKKGMHISSIYFIESEKVRNDKIKIENKEYTSSLFLQEKIDDFLGVYKKYTEYIDIDIKNEPDANEVSETVFEIYRKLIQLANTGKEINIFIESNGGVRYVLTMLLSLTKTLENYFENVHISEITSMILQQNPVIIQNTKEVYDTAQITGIAEEFINYGRTISLQKFMYSKKDMVSEDVWMDIESILKKFDKLADDIQLCRTAFILEDLYGNDNLKKAIDGYKTKYKETTISTINIFKHIISLILDDFNQIIYKDYDLSNPINNLPKTIEWCLKKSFVQQALTFCAERLPEYLVADNFIILGTCFREWLNEEKKGDYEEYYYFLAHMKTFTDRIRKTVIDSEVIAIISESSTSNTSRQLKQMMDSFKNHDDFNTVEEVNIWLENQGYGDYKNYAVKISNKIKNNPLNYTLLGKYYNYKENEVSDHSNLKSKDDIISIALPVFVEIEYDKLHENDYASAKTTYDTIITGLFEKQNNILCEALKNKYSQEQSKKYCVKEVLCDNTKFIGTKVSDEDLQKILYLYSICKEQRNYSNHAHISADDENIALDCTSLSIVIEELLRLLNIGEH